MIDDTFINEFKKFRTTFESRIKKESITYYDNDCYLIDNEWYNELEKKIEIYEKNNSQPSNKKAIYNSRNMRKLNVYFPEQSPVFINDINEAIECFKSSNKPQLISTKLMNKIYKKEDLKNMSVIKYYAGFNNLIIMSMEKDYNNGLLLFNPLDKNNKNNIIFSFKIKNKKNDNNDNKIQFYSELLQMKDKLNDTLIDNLIKNKIICHYRIIKKNEEISYDTGEYFNNNSSENILKIFITIFYYEKSLSSNINDIFSNSQSFNLINPEWFINFKAYYNYEIMNELLDEYENEKKGINYSNLEKNINEILLYIKDKINVDKIELPDKLITSNLINPPPILTKSNIVYNDKCLLIPLRIMDLIKEYTFKNNQISIKPNKIFSKDNNIYIIDSRKIIFGNINDELLFIAKYIFSYDSKDILEKEKDEIYSNTIIEYIQKRDCNQNDSNTQKLKTNKYKKIGDFIILNKDSKAINSNYAEISESSLIKKIANTKRFKNNNKYDSKNTKKDRYHSKYLNKNNYSNEESDENEEIEENKDSNEKE